MKWIPAEIEKLLKSSEYVDTAVVPLLPVSFGEHIKESAGITEFISLLTSQLERQLQGRILLIPGFTYIKKSPGYPIEHLREWEKELMDKPFKHVFYVTSDSDWRQLDTELEGTVLWLPTLPLQHLDEKSKAAVMEDQVRQLMNLFIQKWREED